MTLAHPPAIHGPESLQESEARFRFLSALGEATSDLVDPAGVMEVVARMLGQHLRVSRCAYAEVERDSDHFTIRHDFTDGCASTTGDYELSLFGARAAADQRAGRVLIVHDVDRELSASEGADMFNAIGVQAIICCPLLRSGRLAAMMAVHQTVPRRWSAHEVALVEAVVERSWAFIERARAMRALGESEQNLRQLADAMPQIVWAARPDGALDYYNRRWFEYIQVSPDAVDQATWDKYIHPDDLAHAYELWSASVASGRDYVIEFRVRRHDGQYRWFLVRALPIHGSHGQISRWFGTCTDIHDRKLIDDALRESERERAALLESERAARIEAERASRMKDEFLATLSHELRTPLNAILGWAHMIQRGRSSPEEVAKGVSVIERNARAQAQIIEDLLDMSRIISGKIRLDVQRLDLSSLIAAALETSRPAAEAKAIALCSVLDPLHGVVVTGDANRLQQVLWNLISNAVKFTPRGGRIQVLLERVDSHLELSVVDSGEGLAPEFLSYVFDRFRQADSTTTRRHGGLGLGLAIVKQLVELHGGSVHVRSAGLGLGSTFVVKLPVTAVQPSTPGESERRHPSAPPAQPTGNALDLHDAELAGRSILVVDDEADARALVQRVLEDSQATVMAAGSAEEALTLLKQHRFDLLISDIGMPHQDGYALVRQLRTLSTESGGSVPAIALTAYARAEDRVKALRAGYQMHLVKPIDPTELLLVVASLLRRPSAA
ncbi:MAG: sensor hybrid histidine kinase [Myxococcaceae bacterium]|nr:sensor hybrid histidine kinase [Myxococcaceae bacterium]